MIHPSAFVDPSAQIADSAEIAANAFVGPNCILHAGVKVGFGAVVESNTEIGEGTVLCPNAHVGGGPQDIGYKGEDTRLVIGKNCTIREFATIHRATTKEEWVTTVGDNVYLMAYAHIAHDCHIGNNVIIVNSVQIAGHVHVGDNVLFGGVTGIHQFVRIGRNAMIGGMTKIVQDIPPFMLADGAPVSIRGLNTIGLRRAGMSAETRTELKRAMKIYLDRSLTMDGVREKLLTLKQFPEIVELQEFMKDTKRKFTRRSNLHIGGEEE